MKEINFTENKDIEEEIRLLKNFVLDHIATISFQLGRLSRKSDVSLETELVNNAKDFLIDANVSSKEDYKKLLTYYFILLGMSMDFGDSVTYSLSESEREEVAEV